MNGIIDMLYSTSRKIGKIATTLNDIKTLSSADIDKISKRVARKTVNKVSRNITNKINRKIK